MPARSRGRSDALFGYTVGHPEADLARDDRDSARGMPKGVVIDTAFIWGDDRSPRIPWNETIIYELHVKGFTTRHPDVAKELRGTYGGLVAPPALAYLKSLGVTAVELMPIHHFVSDKVLVDRGLRNYWGYNSLGFFAPDIRYATGRGPGDQVREFKTMVKTLHEAGIEVILDVVYNHTAEGNHLGPTLSFRGIDNAAYYRLVPDDRRYYMDYTGCGNTLNMTHPRTLQLIMDSLRYWIQEMHVDGFRFDLASALARELHDVDRLGAFFDIIQLGHRVHALLRAQAGRRRDRRGGPARRAHRRRHADDPGQRVPRADRLRPPRAPAGRAMGARAGHAGPAAPPPAARGRALRPRRAVPRDAAAGEVTPVYQPIS